MTPALPLSLIPLGTPTGLIVNVGYHDTSVICVYEGMKLLSTVLSENYQIFLILLFCSDFFYLNSTVPRKYEIFGLWSVKI